MGVNATDSSYVNRPLETTGYTTEEFSEVSENTTKEIQIRFDREFANAQTTVTNELNHIEFPKTATSPCEDTLNGYNLLTKISVDEDVKNDNKFLAWFNSKLDAFMGKTENQTPISEAPSGVFTETSSAKKEPIAGTQAQTVTHPTNDKTPGEKPITTSNTTEPATTASVTNTEVTGNKSTSTENQSSGQPLKQEDLEKEMAALTAELGLDYSPEKIKELSAEAANINTKIEKNSKEAHAKGESGTIHETEKRTGLKALSEEEKDAMMEQIKNGKTLTPEQTKKLNDHIRLHESDLKANDEKTIKNVQAFLKNHRNGVSDKDVSSLNPEEQLCFYNYRDAVV